MEASRRCYCRSPPLKYRVRYDRSRHCSRFRDTASDTLGGLLICWTILCVRRILRHWSCCYAAVILLTKQLGFPRPICLRLYSRISAAVILIVLLLCCMTRGDKYLPPYLDDRFLFLFLFLLKRPSSSPPFLSLLLFLRSMAPLYTPPLDGVDGLLLRFTTNEGSKH